MVRMFDCVSHAGLVLSELPSLCNVSANHDTQDGKFGSTRAVTALVGILGVRVVCI
jgi:hypothetical protein